MMATLGLVVGLAPVIGPSVGGSLLAWSAWPALFWLNVPIGMLALFLGWQFVPRGDPQRSPPMDWLGLALISLGLLMVVYALTELGARQHGTALPPSCSSPPESVRVSGSSGGHGGEHTRWWRCTW
jgi:predicted MFS family arabinose efflux permease